MPVRRKSAPAEVEEEAVEQQLSQRPQRKAKAAASQKLVTRDEDSSEQSEPEPELEEEEEDATPRHSPVKSTPASKSVTPREKSKGQAKAGTGKTATAKTSKAGKQSKKPTQAADSDSLYAAICADGKQLKNAINKMFETYVEATEAEDEDGRANVLASLLSTVLQCCGLSHSEQQDEAEEGSSSTLPLLITADMLDDVQDTCQAIQKKCSEDMMADYPLRPSGAVEKKKFSSSFAHFAELLVSECQNDVIFDEYLFNNLIIWLTTLSTSGVRALRHTCALMGLKIGTALLKIALKLGEDLEITQRQHQAEKKKGTAKKASNLGEKITEMETRKGQVHELLDSLFQGVAMHRYRDTVPEIRTLTIEELGVWVNAYREKFLDDAYLKYFGWCLNDKDPVVRRACIEALTRLVEDEEAFSHLQLFTQRFLPRIINMCEDIDNSVVEATVDLMGHLYDREALSQDQIGSICELVYSANKAVSHAAGRFIHRVIFDNSLKDLMADAGIEDEDHKTRVAIKALLSFTADSGANIGDVKPLYIVDSLFDLLPALSNWDQMALLLLQDAAGKQTQAKKPAQATKQQQQRKKNQQQQSEQPAAKKSKKGGRKSKGQQESDEEVEQEDKEDGAHGEEDEGATSAGAITVGHEHPDDSPLSPVLSSQQETLLLAVLLASIQRATGSLSLPGRKKPMYGPQQKKTFQAARDAFTSVLMKPFPEIMGKYSVEAEKCALLVQIPAFFTLEQYEANRCMKQFEQTLKQLTDIILRQAARDVLEGAVSTLRVFSEAEQALSAKAVTAVDELVETLAKRLQEAVEQGVPENDGGEELSEDNYRLASNLARMAEVAREFDITAANPVPALETILESTLAQDVYEEIVVTTITLTFTSLAWGIRNASEKTLTANQLKTLKASISKFVQECDRLLTSGTQAVQSAAFSALADLIVLVQTSDDELAAAEEPAEEDAGKTKAKGRGKAARGKKSKKSKGGQGEEEEEGEEGGEEEGGKATGGGVSPASKGAVSLAFTPTLSVQDRMCEYVLQSVFETPLPPGGDEDEEDEAAVIEANEARLEEEGVRSAALAAFCRLVSFNMVDPMLFATLIPHYKLNAKWSELMRATLASLRENDATLCCKVILAGLERWYNALLASPQADISELTDVAHRIALTFGVDLKKYRTNIFDMCKLAIGFALQVSAGSDEDTVPENLSFLQVAREFSTRLQPQDRAVLAGYLEKCAEDRRLQPSGETWVPYTTLLATLTGKPAPGSAKSASRPSTARKTAGGGSKAGTKRKSTGEQSGRVRKQMNFDDSREEEPARAHDSSRGPQWGNLKKAPMKRSAPSEDEEEEEEEEEEDEEPEEDEEEGVPASSQRSWVARASTSQATKQRGKAPAAVTSYKGKKAAAAAAAAPPPSKAARTTRRSRRGQEEEEEEEEEEDVGARAADPVSSPPDQVFRARRRTARGFHQSILSPEEDEPRAASSDDEDLPAGL